MSAAPEYYRFDDDNRAIVIQRHDLPYPWINYLSNGTLHAFTSQAAGGMCWWKSPMDYRITRYQRHALPVDSPGFYVYIRHADGTYWSPSFRPCDTAPDSWECRHAPGVTTYQATRGDTTATLRLCVAPDEDTMIWDLELTNNGDAGETCDVFAYVELGQLRPMNEFGTGYYQKWAVKTFHDTECDAVLYMNYFRAIPPVSDPPLVFLASTRDSVSHACNRDTFCGNYRDARNPESVERGMCDNEEMDGGEGCAALQVKVSVGAGASERTSFFLGVTPGVLQDYNDCVERARGMIAGLRAEGFVDGQFGKIDSWWAEHFGAMQCTVPDPDVQRQINTWNPVQCVHTGRYSRSISQSATGVRGVGFRDTAQDMLAIAYRRPEWAREMLLYLCRFQFADGHAAHQSYPHRNIPPENSLRSDNHLWVPLLAHAVVSELGDLSLLDEMAPFLAEDLESPDGEGTVWEHLMRGMRFTENNLGSHGLPLIFRSDWNDHFGMFGMEGRGETVFAAEQYVCAMRHLRELAESRDDTESVEELTTLIDKQSTAIADTCWDGGWWVRGFDDDANPVGVSTAEYGRIWLNSQSWAVLGQVADETRLAKAMDSVREHLDSDYGIRIFAPGFPTYPEVEVPKVKWLAPGCAENAGIFCHANTWAVIAEAMLGRADNAWKYYRQLLPHHALQQVGMNRYTAEPYAYVSTIFSPEHVRAGWANVNQVTGTAAWMDVAATQYLLGVKAVPTGLRIDPCVPSDWKEFTVRRRYRGCDVTVTVSNPDGRQKGVSSVSVDGTPVDMTHGPIVPAALCDGKTSVTVTAVM